MYVCIYVCMYVCTVCMHVCCMYMCMCVACICVYCMCVCMCMYAYCSIFNWATNPHKSFPPVLHAQLQCDEQVVLIVDQLRDERHLNHKVHHTPSYLGERRGCYWEALKPQGTPHTILFGRGVGGGVVTGRLLNHKVHHTHICHLMWERGWGRVVTARDMWACLVWVEARM